MYMYVDLSGDLVCRNCDTALRAATTEERAAADREIGGTGGVETGDVCPFCAEAAAEAVAAERRREAAR